MSPTRPSPLTWQHCTSCGSELAEADPRPQCPTCGGLLEIRHQAPKESGAQLATLFESRSCARRGSHASGVWRYAEVVLPSAESEVVSYPEGNTPLLHRPAVARWAGADGLL